MCKHQELGRKLAIEYQEWRQAGNVAVMTGDSRARWDRLADQAQADMQVNLELHKVSCETEENLT